MLAGLLSRSVSVVRVCLCLSLSKDLLNSLSTTVSKPLLSLCLSVSKDLPNYILSTLVISTLH